MQAPAPERRQPPAEGPPGALRPDVAIGMPLRAGGRGAAAVQGMGGMVCADFATMLPPLRQVRSTLNNPSPEARGV